MKKLIFGLITIFISTAGFAQIEVIDTIRIAPKAGNGIEPTAVALNTNTNKVYIANFESYNVSVMDALSNSIITVIPDIWEGRSIAINNNNNRIYILNNMDVSVIDGNADTLITTINLPLGGCVVDWKNLAVNPNTNRVYVTNGRYGTICVIDEITDSVIGEIGAGQYWSVTLDGITIDLKTNKIYVVENPNGDYGPGKVLVINALTDSVIDTIIVGKGAKGIAVSPFNSYVYVTNYDTTTISVIDGTTDSVINTVNVDSTLYAVAVDSNYIYATSIHNNKVYVIDESTMSVVDTIAVEYFPCGIYANQKANYMYVVNKENNSVSVIDRTNRSVDTSIIVGCRMWGKMGVNPTTNRIYVGDNYSRNLFVIDGATNKILNRISVNKCPCDVGVDSKRNKIYVACGQSDCVCVIDGATDSIIDILNVSGTPEWVCVDSLTARVYISNYFPNDIGVIDEISDSVIAVIPVGGGLDINMITNLLYVVHKDTVFVIDGATNCVIDTILLTKEGYELSVNPFTNYIYTICNNPGYVSVIDGNTNSVVDTIQIGSYLHKITVDPSLNRIYVGKFDTGEIYAINGATNSIMGKVTVGKGVRPIALNAANNYLYAGCYYDGAVWVLSDEIGIEESSILDFGLGNAELKILKNPFVQSTVISYAIPTNSDSRLTNTLLTIYDISGSCVKTIVNGEKKAGRYSINLDAKELKTGIYFVRLATGVFKTTKKITVIK